MLTISPFNFYYIWTLTVFEAIPSCWRLNSGMGATRKAGKLDQTWFTNLCGWDYVFMLEESWVFTLPYLPTSKWRKASWHFTNNLVSFVIAYLFSHSVHKRLVTEFLFYFTDKNGTLSQQLKHSKLNAETVKQELTDYKEKATRILQVRHIISITQLPRQCTRILTWQILS